MDSFEPRPMPTTVARAYRDPVDLRRVFLSLPLPKEKAVVVSFIANLIADFGESEVSTKTPGKTQKLSHRARMKRRPVYAVDLLVKAPDYGGASATLPVLARSMEPFWQAEWDAAVSGTGSSWMPVLLGLVTPVLGWRQIGWVKTQISRMVVSLEMNSGPSRRRADARVLSSCLSALDSAERYLEIGGSDLLADVFSRKRSFERSYSSLPSVTGIENMLRRMTLNACSFPDEYETIRAVADEFFDIATSAIATTKSAFGIEYSREKQNAYALSYRLVRDVVHPSLLDVREYR